METLALGLAEAVPVDGAEGATAERVGASGVGEAGLGEPEAVGDDGCVREACADVGPAGEAAPDVTSGTGARTPSADEPSRSGASYRRTAASRPR